MLPKHFRSQFFGMGKLAALSTIPEEFVKVFRYYLVHPLSHHLSLFHDTTLHTKILQPVRVNRRALNIIIYIFTDDFFIFFQAIPQQESLLFNVFSKLLVL